MYVLSINKIVDSKEKEKDFGRTARSRLELIFSLKEDSCITELETTVSTMFMCSITDICRREKTRKKNDLEGCVWPSPKCRSQEIVNAALRVLPRKLVSFSVFSLAFFGNH